MSDIEILQGLRNAHINDTYRGERLSVVLTRAIEALKSQSEGCEHCTIDSGTRKVLGYDGSNDGIGITYGDGVVAIDSDSWEFEINYCPICGRRLI